jgi:hypothetical protein
VEIKGKAAEAKTAPKLKAGLAALLFAAAAIPFVAISEGFDTSNTDNPEFYFTRLRYREGGLRDRGFRFGTMAKPEP